MNRRIWSVMGNSQRLDGGAMFGNAPRALWERWAPPDDRHRIELACRCMLVREPDGRNVLLETGIGAFFEPKLRDRYGVVEEEHLLLKGLENLGMGHEDIDVVILSHLHFDHAGGLLSAWEEDVAPRLLFPKATFLVGERAFNRARTPHARDQASFIPELVPLLQESGRLELVRAEWTDTLGPDYRFHFSDGHTPGLMMTEIPGTGGPILFPSDLIPGRAWIHTSITMGYDRYPELLVDEKRALLEELSQRKGRLFLTHDPEVALCYVQKDERGRFGSAGTKAFVAGVVA